MPEISVMIKPASGLCNMKCDYCFYADEMNNRKQASYGIMQSEVMQEVIKKYSSLLLQDVRLFFKAASLLCQGCLFISSG